MGILKTQPSEIYEMEPDDIIFFRNIADMYIKAMKQKAG